MRLEGVIVCKDYSDFLEHTLPENVQHFDHLVVVTHHTDKATQALCSKYSVECIEAHVFNEDGDRFNKGRAVNVGLAHLKKPDWILHMDADIVLPHRLRFMLEKAKLDPNNLYGCDRVNVHGWDRWMELKEKLNPHYQSNWFVEPPKDFPVGARIIHREHGFVPIGFFQLWNKAQHKKYPIHEGTAEHSDVLFAIQWHPSQRRLLPEVIVYHLDSSDPQGQMGANWNGRKSPWFGPPHKHHKHHHHRHKHHHGYCPCCDMEDWEIQEKKK